MGILDNVFKKFLKNSKKENHAIKENQTEDKRESEFYSRLRGDDLSTRIAREQAKKLLQSPLGKEIFLRENPDLRRVDSLLEYVIYIKSYESLGLKPSKLYYGSSQDVLDQFNYSKLRVEEIFLPYLSLLEENGSYNEKDLPDSIRQLYENYTKKEMNWGITFGVYMGLYNKEIIRKCCKEDSDSQILEEILKSEDIRKNFRVDGLIKDKLPEELMGFVTKQCKEEKV